MGKEWNTGIGATIRIIISCLIYRPKIYTLDLAGWPKLGLQRYMIYLKQFGKSLTDVPQHGMTRYIGRYLYIHYPFLLYW